MGCIWCVRCENFRGDIIRGTCALMTPIRPDLHPSSCSNGMVCEKFEHDLVARTCALISPVRPVLHKSSSSNGTIRNTPKHEFGVQWHVSGMFFCKKFRSDYVAQTCALLAPVWPILHWSSFSNETVQNSNEVYLVRSLRKIPTYHCCMNLCNNDTSLAHFAPKFV
jgi:hypothetical protein